MTTTREIPGTRHSFHVIAGLAASLLLVLSACSGGDVTVEQVERQVQLDPDGRVVDSSASATTFIETGAEPATTTPTPEVEPLTEALATDGTAAIDCGDGARTVEVTDGAGDAALADGSEVEIALVGTAQRDDFDDDGLDDLAAAYRCTGTDGPVALSLSFWRATAKGPTRSAVSVDSIEPDQSAAIPGAPGDAQVGLSVLGPQRQAVREVLAVVDSGRLRLVSDEVSERTAGVESLPLTTFPDSLALGASGLGPLRLGATEEQLTDALSLVVSEVQYPPVPPCFGPADRVLQVGPIYFGLTRSGLRAIWVTGPSLTTTDRTVALAAKLGAGPTGLLTVGEAIDASSPPDGLSVLGFGEDWVGLGSTAAGSGVSVAAEADAPGGPNRNVTGFGVAERVCLRSDFATTG